MPGDPLVQKFQLALQANKLTRVRAFTVLEKADPDTQIGPLVAKIDQDSIRRLGFWHALG